jgi:hypothetical protein
MKLKSQLFFVPAAKDAKARKRKTQPTQQTLFLPNSSKTLIELVERKNEKVFEKERERECVCVWERERERGKCA